VGLGSMEYVPVLKGKSAEIAAALASPKALAMTPLFEIQKAPTASIDRKTGEKSKVKGVTTDASHFLDEIARLWPDPLYVDISRVVTARASREQWWNLLALLNNMADVPVDLMPVVSFDDNAASRAAAGTVAILGRAAMRVPMQLVRQNPALLSGLAALWAADMGLEATDIDVVLDWSNAVDSHTLDTLVSETNAAVHALGGTHGKVIVVGTPEDSSFTQAGDWDPVRREWWLWLRLVHAGVDVVYGDYALYQPSDPVPVQARYGHLRYSSGERMHVHRRAVPASGGGLGGAFEVACAHLLKQPHWLGAGFSKADQRIEDIANQADKAGAAGVWRQIATHHHFALVNSQLAGPPAAPPPGTS
jgi:hypothetical protein